VGGKKEKKVPRRRTRKKKKKKKKGKIHGSRRLGPGKGEEGKNPISFRSKGKRGKKDQISKSYHAGKRGESCARQLPFEGSEKKKEREEGITTFPKEKKKGRSCTGLGKKKGRRKGGFIPVAHRFAFPWEKEKRKKKDLIKGREKRWKGEEKNAAPKLSLWEEEKTNNPDGGSGGKGGERGKGEKGHLAWDHLR